MTRHGSRSWRSWKSWVPYAAIATAVALAVPLHAQAAAKQRTLAEVKKKISRRVTQEQREAAAARQAELRAKAAAAGAAGARTTTTTTTRTTTTSRLRAGSATTSTLSAITGAVPDPVLAATPGGVPHYFTQANWAYSPPLRKFVDGLGGLGAANANNLGQFLSVAHPDTVTYPGSDYYEIELRQFTQQMHSDLPPTTLRGYVQVNLGTDASGQNTIAPDPIRYLGPTIVAQRDRPVRIKFTNKLATGEGGNLFIPVDTTAMGSGMGPEMGGMAEMDPRNPMCNRRPKPMGCYTENRATLHLHGGRTPWISDGTPHQWITPAGEDTPYPKGVSVKNVPDMPDPGDGSMTFFYTNQQSARLMFYHDHAWGITRLNVYAGEAAGYLITDEEEQALVDGGLVPAEQIPLVIQDKTFVDASTVRLTDPTWNWGSNAPDPATGVIEPKTGDLWYPHVYSPAQNPYDIGGMNAFGRWHYGPWFWPPTSNIQFPPVPNPYYDPNDPYTLEPPEMPGVPYVSMPGESFMDTPVVNGTAFPYLEVQPKAYRFRILNAANDRFFNLQLYEADVLTTTADGRTSTEVRMVPAVATPGFPETWPTDGREGGVPDPATAGPSFVQIATEGGFLPRPAVIPNQPIAWNNDPTTFNMGNVSDHALLVAPAERADVVIDFSAYAGKTLILYNDAPAAFPALDARYDYYTGAPDLTDTGGHPGPQPGFGPNTRTVMQIRVAAAAPAPAFDVGALSAAFDTTVVGSTVVPGTFERDQDPIVVGQSAYDSAYGKTFPTRWPYWGYSRIQDQALSFMNADGTLVSQLQMKPKAIQDEMGEAYDLEYGRMSGKLGVELPNTNAQNQNFVLLNYVDPWTEEVAFAFEPAAATSDGVTQLWKITHNGVDTHPIHFHAFDVQLVNRVGWDGAIRLPDANELGWKDTVRVSPLEDTIVALRPVLPKQPFGLPDSVRPFNPMMPLGSMMGFTNVDPLTGQPITPPVTNELVNFGWEYVWHCHILSHEEMDMMRPIVMLADRQLPEQPVLFASAAPGAIRLDWEDGTPPDSLSTWGNPANEIGHRIERAVGTGAFEEIGSALANETSFVDAAASRSETNRYRVVAYNAAGETASNESGSAYVFTPATGVTLSASVAPPSVVGTAVTFTAAGQGSPDPYDYRFWLDSGSGWVMVQDYGNGASWILPGSTPVGSYNVRVDVRTTVAVELDASASVTHVVRQPPATGVTLTASLPSPQVVGTAVVFTAGGQGSSGYDYQFHVYDGTWRIVQPYGGGATWMMPSSTLPGTYRVLVRVRTSDGVLFDASAELSYTIRLSPATGVTLTSDVPSPQVTGTPVTFTAAGQGSSGYDYRFWLYDGTWKVVQEYGNGATWTMPATTLPGTYRVLVRVRTSAAVSFDASTEASYTIRVQPATGVTLTASLPSPQLVGTAVVFTAGGQGSSGYDYQFHVYDGTWRIVQPYGGGATWTMPSSTLPGTYRVLVRVRTSDGVLFDASAELSYTIRLSPATGVTLTSDVPSPQVTGTPVTFTAAGQGSSGYDYRFWLYDGTWKVVQEYGNGATWTMPATTLPGTYRVLVRVRTSAAVSFDASTEVMYVISPLQGVAALGGP